MYKPRCKPAGVLLIKPLIPEAVQQALNFIPRVIPVKKAAPVAVVEPVKPVTCKVKPVRIYAWPENSKITVTKERSEFGKVKSHFIPANFQVYIQVEPFPILFSKEEQSVEEAEVLAWKEWVRMSCCEHTYVRKEFENGAGTCSHCNYFNPIAFEPGHTCSVCSKPTCFAVDRKNTWFCEQHAELIQDKEELRINHWGRVRLPQLLERAKKLKT